MSDQSNGYYRRVDPALEEPDVYCNMPGCDGIVLYHVSGLYCGTCGADYPCPDVGCHICGSPDNVGIASAMCEDCEEEHARCSHCSGNHPNAYGACGMSKEDFEVEPLDHEEIGRKMKEDPNCIPF